MKSNFRLPGPTAVPPQVFAAMQREMIPHRSAEFGHFYTDLLARLRAIHKTESDVLIWPASGSAGWEIAITNLLSPGDEVLALVGGYFGERFAAVAAALELTVNRVDVEWGAAVLPELLAAALDQYPRSKAALITHNETSTGVTNPLAELAAVARERGALTFVDAVSSAAGLPLLVDEWGLDYVMSGSQKAWMCPPGLVLTAIGPRAWTAYDQSRFRRYFWDLGTMRSMAGTGYTPTTPPISLLFGLEAAVSMIEQETIERIWERHRALGSRLRNGIDGLGIELPAKPGYESNTVTALVPPSGMDAGEMVTRLKEEHGITVAAGQNRLSNAIVRIGHMGWVDSDDIDNCLEAIAAVTS